MLSLSRSSLSSSVRTEPPVSISDCLLNFLDADLYILEFSLRSTSTSRFNFPIFSSYSIRMDSTYALRSSAPCSRTLAAVCSWVSCTLCYKSFIYSILSLSLSAATLCSKLSACLADSTALSACNFCSPFSSAR